MSILKRISFLSCAIVMGLSAVSFSQNGALTATADRRSVLSAATDLGPANAAGPIEITLWMKLHDQQGLDALVAAQQAGKAGFLSQEQIRAQHAPSSADVAKVAIVLKAQGFAISGFGRDNFFVRATGTVGLVESAFNVDLHQYNLKGRNFRASSRSATLPPALVPLVSAVGGLSTLDPEPQIARWVPRLRQPSRGKPMRKAYPRSRCYFRLRPRGYSFERCCLRADSGGFLFRDCYPATYKGNRYGRPLSPADRRMLRHAAISRVNCRPLTT